MRLSAAELRTRGNHVWYPQFPKPETPDPIEWQDLIEQESKMMDEVSGGEKIAIAHSLGCLNWMMAAMTLWISALMKANCSKYSATRNSHKKTCAHDV
jgi:predicted alpha/beta hydrolase family esterase